MSRIGKKQILIPEKTEVSFSEGVLTVKGQHGMLKRKIESNISVQIKDDIITLSPNNNSLFSKALWGTSASHIINMVRGVNELYKKQLIIEGVGYKAEKTGGKIILSIGFSHPVEVKIPEDLNVTIEKDVISILGPSKETVGQFAASIRSNKKPEPYKGKGIRYIDEVVRRKEGKKTV